MLYAYYNGANWMSLWGGLVEYVSSTSEGITNYGLNVQILNGGRHHGLCTYYDLGLLFFLAKANS